ncbi:Stk1 family PASTA domain-containing Ser/Thr kinase [Actinocorallia sp. API 0066]|uniref:Stk1 family PASTA domain-containing Ser/Thr kinase n=1 Tax=Actinocorallia sp. API 0066 TaxID=2896846 RepID=UPI001E51E2D0|nr:Stk1 family PASTA domain-containing Ser/Thr kinase [Actinocorallia sp. API 0066]MCD0452474.1 Stk1 family PASTA domain-containing Ser/Thr kinase [Actinocorallia sp. API 0066]
MTQPRLLGGRYELGGVIGRGGMAEVFRARDLRLDRTVAIKTLRTDLARDATFQARFRREAQSAASLNHPSIIAVYDTGEDDFNGQPIPYIVMEFVEGHTLRELIRPEGGQERRLRPERALEIVDGILRALDYSHRGGIIHRDIKPANVMLTRSHEVKVMDFGIARAMSDSAATMTATAQVIGTAQYLSPEQARGERVDARSDLYSTGCVLYELLTGRPPFQGDSPVAIAYQHVREEPIPPSQLDPDIPQWADRIVLKAMTKDPAHRYQSASEFRADIQRAMQGVQVASQSTSTMVIPPAGTQVMGAAGATRVQPPVGPATYAGQGYDDLPPVRYDDTQYGRSPGRPGGGPSGRDDEDEQPGKKAQNLALWVLLGVVIVGLFAGLAAWITSGGGDGDKAGTVEITNVAGMSGDDAKAKLEELGFKVTVTPQASDTVDKGLAIATDPKAGEEVAEGSAVELFVSSGQQDVTIPAGLVGQQIADVRRKLQDELGLVVRERFETTESQAAGTVLKTNPSAGKKVKPGSTVTVTVAKAPEAITLSDLTNMTQVEAQGELERLGLRARFVEISPEGDIDPGHVIRTNPEAGATVKKDQLVTVYVAKAIEVPPTDPNQPDPNQPTDPNLPTDPNQPGDGGDGQRNDALDKLTSLFRRD